MRDFIPFNEVSKVNVLWEKEFLDYPGIRSFW
jgi:hypothetical protein